MSASSPITLIAPSEIDLGGAAALFALQHLASEPYSRFVFDTDADADEFWALLFERGVAEFSAPHGRLAVQNGNVIGLIACLDHHELRAKRLRAAGELNKSGFFLARPDAQRRLRLAGRAMFVPQPGDYYLSRLAVVADARRQGVGSRLAAMFEAEGAARGCRRLTLDVSAGNAEAIALYENCGFTTLNTVSVDDSATGRRLAYTHMTKAVA